MAANTAGNENYSGSLGMDFVVNQPITLTELGGFDADSNGINASRLTRHTLAVPASAAPLRFFRFRFIGR